MDHNYSPLAHQVPDAARRIGIGRSLLYDLIKQGRLSVVKIGCRTLITDAELRRFLAEAESSSKTQRGAG